MSNVFLGEPSEYIRNWFIETFPSWPTYTTLKFKDGTTQTKEIIGVATWKNMGLKSSQYASNSTLKSCQLGNKVTEISGYTFYNCNKLSACDIPSSVTSIGANAFSNCSSLPSITIPNSVYSIENSTFSGCSSLTSISIPSSVTSIGSDAFYRCYSLTSINIPNSVISIGNNPFSGIANEGCGSYQSLTLVMFAGRTLQQVQAMAGYPWSITDISIISAELD